MRCVILDSAPSRRGDVPPRNRFGHGRRSGVAGELDGRRPDPGCAPSRRRGVSFAIDADTSDSPELWESVASGLPSPIPVELVQPDSVSRTTKGKGRSGKTRGRIRGGNEKDAENIPSPRRKGLRRSKKRMWYDGGRNRPVH